MGLRQRFRDFLEGRPTSRNSTQRAPIGVHPTAAMEEEWKELPEQVDGALKKLGSAVVSTWEVGASELARGLVGRADEKTLIDRYSDSLVPTLAPFQDLHKGCSSAMEQAWRAARQADDLRALTPPLVGLLAQLGDRATAGWAKTTEYLAPVFALAPDPAAERDRFLKAGAVLGQACVAREALLRTQLEKLPDASSLSVGINDAFDVWQEAMVRDIEMGVHAAVMPLATAIRRD